MSKKSIIILIYHVTNLQILFTFFNHMAPYQELTHSLLKETVTLTETLDCYCIQ
jgi:hypothetical protein